MQKQIRINLDKEFKACWNIRKKITEKIININTLIQKIRNLNLDDIYSNNFLSFIEDLASEKYEKQRNNHNLMKTFLKEKIETHDRIQYNLLADYLKKGYLPYASNLAPKSIMSNYFVSNQLETLLRVKDLEKTFQNFTWSERVLISKTDKYLTFDTKTEDHQLIKMKIKLNDNSLYPEEVEDIRDYFALQLTRREFYLHNIIQECLKGINKTEIESIDLLDYLYCKYIYNQSLLANFNNWKEYLKLKQNIYQIQYKQCVHDINYSEVKKHEATLIQDDYKKSNLAITETHTFIVKELIQTINEDYLNNLLKENGFSKFTTSELEFISDIVVTIGSDDKLCYLMSIEPNNDLFDKINFVIHSCWDKSMSHTVLVNFLVNKNSSINNINYFQNAKISSDLLDRAKFMYSIFKISKKYEESIKKDKI